MRKGYDRTKWGYVLRGLLGIGMGIFIFARPLESLAALALAIAIWALMDGIATIVHAFDVRGVAAHWGVQLLGGIVSMVFGIAALYRYPELSLAFAILWTSFWLLSIGVVSVYAAVLQRRAGVAWGWALFIVVPSIVAGVLALAFPGATLISLMVVIAAYGIIGGIGMIVAAGLMGAKARRIERALRTSTKAA